jgi:hypothetical protein
MAMVSFPHFPVVKFILSSVKLCLSLSAVNCLCACEMGLFFNYFMYFVLPETGCILL